MKCQASALEGYALKGLLPAVLALNRQQGGATVMGSTRSTRGLMGSAESVHREARPECPENTRQRNHRVTARMCSSERCMGCPLVRQESVLPSLPYSTAATLRRGPGEITCLGVGET